MAKVNVFVGSALEPALSVVNNINVAGKKIKFSEKATVIPMVIIHPKSITGRISLTTKEQNATMVVIAV